MNRVDRGYYNDRFFRECIGRPNFSRRRPCRNLIAYDCFGAPKVLTVQKGDSVRTVLFRVLGAFGAIEFAHPEIYEGCRLFDGAHELPEGPFPDDVQSVFVVKPVPSAGLNDPEQIKQLLRHENHLRTHPSVQAVLRAAPTDDAWMDMITDLTFRPAASAAGLCGPDVDRAVAVMKSAADIWKDDKEFMDISLWRKYNRAADVEFKVGDFAPCADVIYEDTYRHDTLFLPDDPRTLIVVSSSIT